MPAKKRPRPPSPRPLPKPPAPLPTAAVASGAGAVPAAAAAAGSPDAVPPASDGATVYDAESVDAATEGSSGASEETGTPTTPAGGLLGQVLRGGSFVMDYAHGGDAGLMRRLPSMRRRGAERGLIPAARDDGKLLVVFDIDETIIYAREGPLVLRPHARQLLRMCGERCELALWTAGARDYAKAVLHEINKAVWGRSPAGVVKHLITRHRSWFNAADYTKDLKKLGRSLDRVLIVENTPDCVRLNPSNAIIVEDFEGHREGHATMRALQEVIESLSQSALPVAEFLPACAQLELQRVEGQDAEVDVYYLKAGRADARKEVKQNLDRAAAADNGDQPAAGGAGEEGATAAAAVASEAAAAAAPEAAAVAAPEAAAAAVAAAPAPAEPAAKRPRPPTPPDPPALQAAAAAAAAAPAAKRPRAGRRSTSPLFKYAASK